jgi:hypothetical protein
LLLLLLMACLGFLRRPYTTQGPWQLLWQSSHQGWQIQDHRHGEPCWLER